VTLDDASWVADLMTARLPDEPQDPAGIRHWWASVDPERTQHRWIVEERDEPIGFAWYGHAPWARLDVHYAQIGVNYGPGLETTERIGRAFDVLEPHAVADGAAVFVAGTRDDRDAMIAALSERGYHEERRSKSWELDLVANRARLLAMTESSRERMRREGIEVTTLDRVTDRGKFHKLHAMVEESVADVPTTVPHLPEPFDVFMRWFDSPGLRLDRFWVARQGDAVVGLSVLEYPPSRGNVWTDYTGTARTVRGRGVARALKCETVAQAIALGITRVRTNNDGENAPILHLNEEMGYAPIPGKVEFHKPAHGAPAQSSRA